MAIVSVFGASAPKPGSAAYVEAMTMGRLLAEAGYTVATGGYGGVMEAASRGAAEAGGQVIGVTCALIENWREGLAANRWVHEEVRFASLRERLFHLVSLCDAAVALGGGIGTLSEVSFMWSMAQTGEIARKPLVLVGPLWRETISTFLSQADGFVRPADRDLLGFAGQVDEVVKMLKNSAA
jgi:uncharacterized protein (TIGR00730 family)